MSRKLILAFLLAALASTGCAMVQVYPARPGDAPKGARVYPPKIYLLVDTTTSELVTIPDLCRPYDLVPLTILAKQEFKVEADGGMLKSLTANQDTTAFLTFLAGAAELAAKAAGTGVSHEKLAGTFGLAKGVYEFAENGGLRVVDGGTCKGWLE